MNMELVVRHKNILIIAFLVLCMATGFWIRIIPSDSFSYPGYLGLRSPDVWYNLRQIEVTAHNFPHYAWFDPMTAFPTGKSVSWGPLLTTLGAAIAVLMNATSRPDILYVTAYLGPVVATALIPLVFLLGRYIWDTWAGIIAALFITVGTTGFYYRTVYGFVDHHGLEAFLSCAFVLVYTAALHYTQGHPVSFKDKHSLLRPSLLAVLAGFIFFLGFLNMPSMILFAFIVAVFSFFAFIYYAVTGKPADHLLLVNSIVFLIVVVAFLIFGIKSPSMALVQYSLGQFICYILVLAGTLALWILGKAFKNIRAYLLAVLALSTASFFILSLLDWSVVDSFFLMFVGGGQAVSTIFEMQGYTLESALRTYNFGLILASAGLVILIWKTYKSYDLRLAFLIVWSLLVMVLTFRHNRFEYYFAVNFALLSGIAVSRVLSAAEKGIRLPSKYWRDHIPRAAGGKRQVDGKERKEQRKPVTRGDSGDKTLKLAAAGLVLIPVVLFVGISLNNDLAFAHNPGFNMMDADWVETLLWMKTGTPPTGIDFLGTYDRGTFVYPEEAYGVMAWCDYGHYITFIGERIPNTNPFQDHLAGPKGAAAFFMSQEEEAAVTNLDHAGSRFIITNTEMVFPIFPAIAEWYNSSAGDDPYRKRFFFPDSEKKNIIRSFAFNTPDYYRTMIPRLHLFDGSDTAPTKAYYMEYQDRQGLMYPLVGKYETLPVSAAMEKAAQFNANASPGTGAAALSGYVMDPLGELPALRHFRLVHESTNNSSRIYSEGSDERIQNTPHIKVFEYVRGARIRGEGTIEVDVVTNTGRHFTYRQQSVNGEFTVPYPTTGELWAVRTIGNYRLIDTNSQIAVTEQDVIEGRTVGIP